MMKRIKENSTPQGLVSYLGLLKHGNTFKIKKELLNSYWMWEDI